ncbi:putative aconitate hydratase, mitochondrial [Candidatus Nitrosotenuis uzonensis]|uniref:Aconitate hydratase, mitochondrial n=2 Tax=Candidatus Nitrosotenuis uzonensis TaxID=1407055 RepID=V6ATY3_9ARCH|nr:putative aconitate hydratase, mitochondrial [Candidatus Nitrosotenuis uzonensis]
MRYPEMEIQTTSALVLDVYKKLEQNISKFRKLVNRPLTLSEKILIGHMSEYDQKEPERGKSYVFLKPDRVALQDVTGQTVMLEFMQAGLKQVALPTTVHCDHLIQAKVGAEEDTRLAIYENNEVYKFLESAARKYGAGFWKPGAGIIHQVVLENYAFPGGLMIGTDSHTPNAGGLGMIAVGVGGMDAAEVMAGMPWELLYPKRIGVYLKGQMNGWTAPKDIILYVAGQLTVSGGTNAVIEYFGPGAKTISCTGKATITNMGAEIGATCSIFPYDEKMDVYLRATGRAEIADVANKHKDLLTEDPEVEQNPEKYFDKVIEIDLSKLEPHIVGPHTPDLARPISKLAKDVKENKYIDEISVALIGSCTNSSYEDMSRASSIAQQAISKGVKAKVPLLVTPGSEQIRATIERDGQMQVLKEIGATVLANACGPCIGQWSRPELKKDEANTIITSFNRNFPGRNDGKRNTMNFIGSPELIIALSLGGKLSFNPVSDELVAKDGTKFKLQPPEVAPEVPSSGFKTGIDVYVPPAQDPDSVEVLVDKNSTRLQLLEPFEKWNGKDLTGMPVMVKAKGKCTTDHISPAGPWLMYRGHLDKLSDNLLLGAVNAFSGEVGKGKNILTGNVESLPSIARQYKSRGLKWVIIGDNNYGEGSSREHAALTPRYLGCGAVIAKSFARIHETNLKKQGILALTFSNPSDYDKVREDDRISLVNLDKLAQGRSVKCILDHLDGSKDEIELLHSYNSAQIEWFRQGSALNVLREKNK